MKRKEFTTDILLEVEDKEFEIQATAYIGNDSLGCLEYWGHKIFHSEPDYLQEIIRWKPLDNLPSKDYLVIEDYVNRNEEEILEKMRDTWND